MGNAFYADILKCFCSITCPQIENLTQKWNLHVILLLLFLSIENHLQCCYPCAALLSESLLNKNPCLDEIMQANMWSQRFFFFKDLVA